MSKLREVFESLKHMIHYGPAMKPFHDAAIEEYEALADRVTALEAKQPVVDEMVDLYEATKQEHKTTTQALQEPAYIEPEHPAAPEATAAPVTEPAAPDAPAAVAEPVAADVGDKAVDLQAKPDPASAAPNTSATAGVRTY